MMLPPATAVGWWVGGAQVGQAAGSLVLAGHLDDDEGRTGALAGVGMLRPGHLVIVTAAAGPATYRVREVRSYSKQRLPAELFGSDGPPRLVLITCGGEFTPGSGYADNVVALADAVR